ncbi:MAG: SDR family NAD(P)-dependent oxidoreductase [Streptosporangiaceae bacterium]
MENTNRLAGKVALVTGGGRGIGAEIVRRLVADGADVAFTYVTSQDAAGTALVREGSRHGYSSSRWRSASCGSRQGRRGLPQAGRIKLGVCIIRLNLIVCICDDNNRYAGCPKFRQPARRGRAWPGRGDHP